MARFRDKLRWLISLLVLIVVLLWIDPRQVLAQVASLHIGWLILALVVTLAQTLLSAWRWRFTAHRLGLILSFRHALSDYYLACFANQTLPGGVLGDAWRAQRHANHSGQPGAAWRAVILERACGQLLVIALGLISLLSLANGSNSESASLKLLRADSFLAWLLVGGAVMVLGLAARFALTHAKQRWPHLFTSFYSDLQAAVLAREAWPGQLISSLLIVGSYCLVFALAGRAIGVEAPWLLLISAALPVLLAMLIPFSVAGWGWREAMAGGLWFSLGLPPEQGIAISISYGVIVFLGSAPGLLVWLAQPRTLANKNHAHHKDTGCTEKITK